MMATTWISHMHAYAGRRLMADNLELGNIANTLLFLLNHNEFDWCDLSEAPMGQTWFSSRVFLQVSSAISEGSTCIVSQTKSCALSEFSTDPGMTSPPHAGIFGRHSDFSLADQLLTSDNEFCLGNLEAELAKADFDEDSAAEKHGAFLSLANPMLAPGGTLSSKDIERKFVLVWLRRYMVKLQARLDLDSFLQVSEATTWYLLADGESLLTVHASCDAESANDLDLKIDLHRALLLPLLPLLWSSCDNWLLKVSDSMIFSLPVGTPTLSKCAFHAL